MKLYLHHLPGLEIVRANVADPFIAGSGVATLRPEAAESGVELCARVEDADVCGLPAHWSTYESGHRRAALRFIEERRQAGQRVMIWVVGDDERDFPFSNVIAFQHAVRRSRRRSHEVRIYPPFLDDLMRTAFDGSIPPRVASGKPVVGFCGQAKANKFEEGKRFAYKFAARIRRASGRTLRIPEPWESHVKLRQRVLAALASDPRISTNFLVRDRYRDGLIAKQGRRNPRHPSAREFYLNILGSDYTACVRGGGNYSVRLYETLCLGRLPLIVDADGLLPWPDDERWREVALIVPIGDLDQIGYQLQQHASASGGLSPERFAGARSFWLERLSRTGYFSHFRELLEQPVRSTA
jgi:hypothetical protein